MDTSPKFALIAKHILRELRTLNEAVSAGFLGVQKQIESATQQQYAEKKRDHAPPVLRAEFQTPEAVEHKREAERKKRVRREWYALVLNLLTLAAVAIYALINYHMLRQMTRESDAAIRSANVAEGQLDLAQCSLSTTIDSFHLDQRAWIGQTEVAPPAFDRTGKAAYLKAGEKTSFVVYIINSGKTPARNVTQENSYRSLPSGVKFSPRYPGRPQRMGIVQPGLRLHLATPSTEQASQSKIETYMRGDNILYLYGRITYEDVFGKPHQTTYCMFLLKDLTSFTDCDTYNNAD